LLGLLLTFCCLLTAFWLSWHALAQFNFGYGAAYKMLGIEAFIQHYAPENRFRHGFELTTPQQQQQLFAEIVSAIQHGGKGLAAIRYPLGSGEIPLLREPEVVHLQDVANLISLFNQAAVMGVLVLAGLILLYRGQRRAPPTVKQITVGMLLTGTVLGLLLLLAGPTQLFYWLHTRVFPDGHQWFFYYQESLMTTLMKAPDLFGFIGCLWGLSALLLFVLGQWGLLRLLQVRR